MSWHPLVLLVAILVVQSSAQVNLLTKPIEKITTTTVKQYKTTTTIKDYETTVKTTTDDYKETTTLDKYKTTDEYKTRTSTTANKYKTTTSTPDKYKTTTADEYTTRTSTTLPHKTTTTKEKDVECNEDNQPVISRWGPSQGEPGTVVTLAGEWRRENMLVTCMYWYKGILFARNTGVFTDRGHVECTVPSQLPELYGQVDYALPQSCDEIYISLWIRHEHAQKPKLNECFSHRGTSKFDADGFFAKFKYHNDKCEPTCKYQDQCDGSCKVGDKVYPHGSTVVSCGSSCTCYKGALIDCCRRRRNWKDLSVAERTNYIETVLSVANGTAGASIQTEYNDLIALHATSSNIHGIEQFLAWHRWYILEIENLLRKVDKCITVPYWAWELESTDPWGIAIWSDSPSQLGGPQPGGVTQCVPDGPFGPGFTVTPSAGGGCLRRRLSGSVSSAADMAVTLSTPATDFSTFFNLLNGDHGNVHVRIGGTMGSVSTASNAPEFFMHHANIDRYWGLWQDKSASHFSACQNPNAVLSDTGGLQHVDLQDLTQQPGNICVQYMRPRIRLWPVFELLAAVQKSFLLEIIKHVPRYTVWDTKGAGQWIKSVYPDKSEDEIESYLKELYAHRLNQPVLYDTPDNDYGRDFSDYYGVPYAELAKALGGDEHNDPQGVAVVKKALEIKNLYYPTPPILPCSSTARCTRREFAFFDPHGDGISAASPDFRSLTVVLSDNQAVLRLTIEDMDSIGSFIYLHSPYRHDMIKFSTSGWGLYRDDGMDGHYETTIIATQPLVYANDYTLEFSIDLSLLPDMLAKQLWVYSMTSQDRMPDEGTYTLDGVKRCCPQMYWTFSDPSDVYGSSDWRLLAFSLTKDSVTIDVSVEDIEELSGSLYMYSEDGFHDEIKLSRTTFNLRRDYGADGHFETSLLSGDLETEDNTARMKMDRSYFPDILQKEVWLYSMSSLDRAPDDGKYLLNATTGICCPRKTWTFEDTPYEQLHSPPDFQKLKVVVSKSQIVIDLYVTSLTNSAGFVYLHGDNHDMISFSNFGWSMHRDTNLGDGHYETTVLPLSPSYTISISTGLIVRFTIDRTDMSDILSKEIWVYSMNSQDRMPDYGSYELFPEEGKCCWRQFLPVPPSYPLLDQELPMELRLLKLARLGARKHARETLSIFQELVKNNLDTAKRVLKYLVQYGPKGDRDYDALINAIKEFLASVVKPTIQPTPYTRKKPIDAGNTYDDGSASSGSGSGDDDSDDDSDSAESFSKTSVLTLFASIIGTLFLL